MPGKTALETTGESLARLAAPDDNCAIAVQSLQAGATVNLGSASVRLIQAVLEGHRFATKPIGAGEALLSWGMPFGYALEPINRGQWVVNQAMLEELGVRGLDTPLPDRPNFRDRDLEPARFDPTAWRPPTSVQPSTRRDTFRGYPRPGGRGVGTRNTLVVLGTSSLSGGIASRLAESLTEAVQETPGVSSVAAVAHTEGASQERPNNLELALRSLAGFVVHPNVAAVLAIDYGPEWLNNRALLRFIEEHDYPLEAVPHHFMSVSGNLEATMRRARRIVLDWLPKVAATPTSQPLSCLKLALQCGGSDAFSGISANPLVAWVAREVILQDGSANLAETDELIGAETYLLNCVRDPAMAEKFLATIARFQTWSDWHGQTAEGNPSGGNRFRGLYNITLKSLGAAVKCHPETALDSVIDYAERMQEPGCYFMDSPGNDLESVAGQVASGANLIFFTTGNGSITNFPFVPTVKVMTTTRRYQLLSREMDFNAGAYLDGTPLEKLGPRLLRKALAVASGQLSCGERAGHSQVSIWRDWRQTDATNLVRLQTPNPPSGHPLQLPRPRNRPQWAQAQSARFPPPRIGCQIGLILPTSLCSGQVAQLAAERLNRARLGFDQGIKGFVALVHTEGCGSSGDAAQRLYERTMIGYLAHPMVKLALLLEHGCEKTHNAYMKTRLERAGLDPCLFGYASVQLDGGLEKVMAQIGNWFQERLQASPFPKSDLKTQLRVGLMFGKSISRLEADVLAELSRELVEAGGTVVVPHRSLDNDSGFVRRLCGRFPKHPSLSYGQTIDRAGFHLMEAPTQQPIELLTGLGATGVHLLVVGCRGLALPAHPLVPTLQYSASPQGGDEADLDLILPSTRREAYRRLRGLISAWARNRYTPRYVASGHTGFQLSRGLLGVSA